VLQIFGRMVFDPNITYKERSALKVKSITPIRKIKTEFTLQNATNFGGFKIFLEYLEKIKLE